MHAGIKRWLLHSAGALRRRRSGAIAEREEDAT